MKRSGYLRKGLESFGIFLVKEILNLTRITIRETGEPGSGARFEMFVPSGVYQFHSLT